MGAFNENPFIAKCINEIQKEENRQVIYGATIDPMMDYIRSKYLLTAMPYYIALIILLILLLITNITLLAIAWKRLR